MKKIYIICAFVLLLSGCTADYNLTISDNKIVENFSTQIYKTEIPVKTDNGIELDDQLTPFIEQNQNPFINNDEIVYDKNVIEEDDYRLVDYSFSYSKEEFADSTVLNRCFENAKYSYKNNYKFILTGTFYCLYNDQLNIKVKTSNKVLSHNADNVDGNTYIWHIDKSNVDNVNIRMKIERNSVNKFVSRYSLALIVLSVSIIIGIGMMVAVIRKNKHNKI